MGNCLSVTLEAYGITLAHEINSDVKNRIDRIYITSATGFEPARENPTDF